MAVFTAAALAIGAAIATTTVATVATAVVATSIAIGVAGLAVTAVGMVTKNESLLKAGKIMGYVGLAGGLAGGAIGGIGGMMEGGAGFMQGAQNAYSGAADAIGEAWKGSIFNPSDGAAVTGAVPETGQAAAGANQPFVADATNPGVNAAAPSTSVGPSAGPASATSGNYQMVADPSMVAPAPVSPVTATPMPGAVTPPVTPTTPGALPINTSIQSGIDQAGQVGAGSVLAPGGAPVVPPSGSFLSNIPDWVKYSGMNTAGQCLSGAASGWYAGASAEQKLEFDKLMNEQRQNQVQYLNKNNTYAPLLSFAR